MFPEKPFIKEGVIVWYLYPNCIDEPIQTGEIEALYDDGSVDIDSKYFGTVNVDIDQVFESIEELQLSPAYLDLKD